MSWRREARSRPPPEPEGEGAGLEGAHPSSASLAPNSNEYPLLSKRAASKKTLTQAPQFKQEEFSVPVVCGSGPPPSRRREERDALQNLRRRVPAHHLSKSAQPTDTPPQSPKPVAKVERDDATTKLLRKILWTRPLSVVVELSEVRTAWQDSDFITECLCWHNVYRQRHGSPPLSMAPELCNYAQTWANHLAHTNKFSYRNDRSIGQNLYQRPVNTLQSDVTGQEVSSYWYAAVRQYDYFKEPDILHANVNAGHFTQVVWVSTRFFGVGKARSRAGKIIVVANYSPPGNVSGAFELNVLPPIPDYNVPGPVSYEIDNQRIINNIKNMSNESIGNSENSDQ